MLHNKVHRVSKYYRYYVHSISIYPPTSWKNVTVVEKMAIGYPDPFSELPAAPRPSVFKFFFSRYMAETDACAFFHTTRKIC